MRVLALNPFHAGSHRAFLEGWSSHSRHCFEAMTLPGHSWKWRMRYAAVEFAERARTRELPPARGEGSYGAVFATDMMNLAEWRGLCPPELARVPTVLYMHENQFAYPVRDIPGNDPDRDAHFAMTNVVSALAADRVWFNSEHNRHTFFQGAHHLLSKFSDVDRAPLDWALGRSRVRTPGIDAVGPTASGPRGDGPLRIVWNHRWEHDKDPSMFVDALRGLREQSVPFLLTVLGETHGGTTPDPARIKAEFERHIEHWGYAESREEYADRLRAADVVVSTARHEFFGLAVLEAASAGCVPCVPGGQKALAYTETLGLCQHPLWTHDGTAAGLIERLMMWSQIRATKEFATHRAEAIRVSCAHEWPWAASALDDALDEAVAEDGSGEKRTGQ